MAAKTTRQTTQMPAATRSTRGSGATTSQPRSRATSTGGGAPPVGTATAQATQPTAGDSRDMQISEPRRNPAGRSGRPSGPEGLKHDGTREAPSGPTREDTARAAAPPTTRTRSTAADPKNALPQPASREALDKPQRGRRVATEATAGVTGLRPEGPRGGHNRTPSRSDATTSSDTGRVTRSR